MVIEPRPSSMRVFASPERLLTVWVVSLKRIVVSRPLVPELSTMFEAWMKVSSLPYENAKVMPSLTMTWP